MPRYPYNPHLTEAAKTLRKNMTPAERKLWKLALSKNQLNGTRWLRQRPILNFIVDFYCPSQKLIIEVDGAYHSSQRYEDNERSALLASLGLSVIRFSNTEVLDSFESVKEKIIHAMSNPG